jgi:ABC-type lipoprotein release transport system permease subunit
MRTAKLGRLVMKNVVRSRRTLFFSSIGVVVGIATFLFFLSLGFGLERLFRDKVFKSLPPNEIEVVPEVFATGRAEDARKASLGDEELEKVKRIPKVTGVFRRYEGAAPATAYIQEDDALRRFGRRIPLISLLHDGVPPDLVQSDVEFFGKREKFRDHGDDPGKPIPVVIANWLYHMYATSAALTLKIPVFPREVIVGFRFNIRMGEDLPLRRRAKQGQIRELFGEVVGFSSYANKLGLTLPVEYVDRFNREYEGPEAAGRYKSLIVKTASPEDKLEVTQRLKELGFRPEVDHQAEMVVQIVTTITLILTIVSFFVVIISAVHIMHTFFMLVYERKAEIGLMRSLGATTRDVRLLIVGEAFLLGFLSGAAGVLLGYLATFAVDAAIPALAPTFSQFRGESFFAFPWWVVVGAVGFAGVFCALGAILPARQAARMEPARALAVQ